MASLTRHKDGWRAHVYVSGRRSTKVFEKRRDAQAWAADKERELGKLAQSGHTFGQATAHYLQTVSPNKVDAVEWETRRFAALTEFFGAKTPLTKITSAEVGKWRDERLKTVKGSTVLREANLLVNMFKLAHEEWKWIPHQPWKGVRWPEDSDDKEEIWGWRQIRQVLRYCERGGPKQQEVGRAFLLALRTGMRLNEVLAAKLVGQVAVLPRQKTSKKNSGPVKVPLTRHGRRLLAKSAPFVVGPNEASTLFSDITEQLGIRRKKEPGLTFHDSRATFATLMARKVDVMTLAELTRHRDINILRRKYYRETAEQIAARL
jgi:integrase